ncbi:MAG: copper amine oxidase N-terminal domain-containing protein [Clostridiales bacterium]|nr:copper amine oxidase N-terminal domain-containing protein [Clostridiales bacterium]
MFTGIFKKIFFVLLIVMIVASSIPTHAEITDGYWRLEKVVYQDEHYVSETVTPNIVKMAVFDDFDELLLKPEFEPGKEPILGSAYVTNKDGSEGVYRSLLEFTHPPVVLNPNEPFKMEFYGKQISNSTDLMIGMTVMCYHQLLYPEGAYQPPIPMIEDSNAGISLMSKERGEEGLMQMKTAHISPRIPDEKRELGYIFRVEVKNNKAYRRYDYIYRWSYGTFPGEDEIRVYIDNKILPFDVPPLIINSRTMLPVRAILEALGADVLWDGKTQTITATKGETSIVMVIGSSEAYVNGVLTMIDAPPVIIESRTLVPARLLAESMKAKVGWDGITRVVEIQTQ